MLKIRQIAIVAVLLPLLALPACASHSPPGGGYKDYRDYAFTKYRNTASDAIPGNDKIKIANCMADISVANVTPAQLQQLDAWASRGTPLPPDLGDQVTQQIDHATAGLPRGDYSVLRAYCPQDADAIGHYFAGN